jgi:hypothetical protein
MPHCGRLICYALTLAWGQRMQFAQLKRREFITLLGGAAASWPLAAGTQQSAMPVIGFLHPASPDGNSDRVRSFRQGLKDAGFVEGENVAVEYRWGDNQSERLTSLAADLVRRRVALIVAASNVAALTADPCCFPHQRGASLRDALRQLGGYAGRVLKGRQARRPAGPAVEQVRACHQSAGGEGDRARGAQRDAIAGR